MAQCLREKLTLQGDCFLPLFSTSSSPSSCSSHLPASVYLLNHHLQSMCFARDLNTPRRWEWEREKLRMRLVTLGEVQTNPIPSPSVPSSWLWCSLAPSLSCYADSVIKTHSEACWLAHTLWLVDTLTLTHSLTLEPTFKMQEQQESMSSDPLSGKRKIRCVSLSCIPFFCIIIPLGSPPLTVQLLFCSSPILYPSARVPYVCFSSSYTVSACVVG